MSNSAIAASGLRKAYGDKIVLDGIDLDVRAGTVFSLLGPNGAGKTTTVNVLTTLMTADAGTARVAGHDIATETRAVRSLLTTADRPEPAVGVLLSSGPAGAPGAS